MEAAKSVPPGSVIPAEGPNLYNVAAAIRVVGASGIEDLPAARAFIETTRSDRADVYGERI